jgi:4'-phosphopantetheinyl transferase
MLAICVNERDDYRAIDADGYDAWIDIYSSFSHGRWSMKYDVDYVTMLDGSILWRRGDTTGA